MRVEELNRRLADWAPGNHYLTVSLDAERMNDLSYNVVTREDGTALVYGPGDRGTNFLVRGVDGSPRVFADEDEAGDWIWGELTRQKAVPVSVAPLDPVEQAENRRRIRLGILERQFAAGAIDQATYDRLKGQDA